MKPAYTKVICQISFNKHVSSRYISFGNHINLCSYVNMSMTTSVGINIKKKFYRILLLKGKENGLKISNVVTILKISDVDTAFYASCNLHFFHYYFIMTDKFSLDIT